MLFKINKVVCLKNEFYMKNNKTLKN